MGRLVLFLSLLVISPFAEARSFHIINVDSLNIEYQNYALLNAKNRNALLYPESIKESIKLNLNTSLLLVGYLNQSVNGLTTDAQYRGIEYSLELGAHIHELFDAYYFHKSSHLFDRAHPYMKFPVEDAIGIRIHLIRPDTVPTIF